MRHVGQTLADRQLTQQLALGARQLQRAEAFVLARVWAVDAVHTKVVEQAPRHPGCHVRTTGQRVAGVARERIGAQLGVIKKVVRTFLQRFEQQGVRALCHDQDLAGEVVARARRVVVTQ